MPGRSAGYRRSMPGDEDGLTPDAAPAGDSDEHSRIADKKRFTGRPDDSGIPDSERVFGRDAEDQLDSDPEDVSLNRRDVPDAPANSAETRTEDG